MLYPIKVVDIELSQPIPTFEDLDGYMGLQGLVRLHGVPLGYVKAPISLGQCSAATLSKLILEEHSEAIICQLLRNGLASPQRPEEFTLEALIDLPPVEYDGEWPLVTVAVCTRDRPEDMKLCLEGISKLDYPKLDVLVVDNAPQTEATKELVESHYPQVRYVREPRPGLDWARNRAILEAKGEVIAYTDDDVVVDPGWVKGLAQVFAENPEVMGVTGLIVPYELETKTQVLFEAYGGFGRGFQRKWNRVVKGEKMPWGLMGTGQFGAGANMAYRRSIFNNIGYFDLAMDVGTVTNGGGDLEMYYRILKEGHTLVYEPNAVVRHRHRRDYSKLKSQITNNGIGLYSYFTCAALRYPEDKRNFISFGIYWLLAWHIRRLIISFVHPSSFPQELIIAELYGFLQSFGRYHAACRRADEIISEFPHELLPPSTFQKAPTITETVSEHQNKSVHVIELSNELRALTDVSQYADIKVIITCKRKLVGAINIQNTHQPVSADRLVYEITSKLGIDILEAHCDLVSDRYWTLANSTLSRQWDAEQADGLTSESLPTKTPVSIIISTCNRPKLLQQCLIHLIACTAHRAVEIIVVDRRPNSGLTPPVVAEFPNVKVLPCTNSGVAHSRNHGILSSSGEIAITIDDATVVTDHWLESILSPFIRPEVMATTGNILPSELGTRAQRWFEVCGGTSNGFEEFEVDGSWFEACPYRTVPTWHLGSCSNAAFRTDVFRQPEIGLLNEALGGGTPTGSGDDLYLFYRITKAGYTVVYQPSALALHTSLETMKELRWKIFNDGKGHTAYQLQTLIKDKDLRVLMRLFVGLPLQYIGSLYHTIRGWSAQPIWMILLELAGNIVGPLALLMSYIHLHFLRMDNRTTRFCSSKTSSANEIPTNIS